MSSVPPANTPRKRKSGKRQVAVPAPRARRSPSRVVSSPVQQVDDEYVSTQRQLALAQDSDSSSALGAVRATGLRFLRGAKDLALQTAQLPGSTAKVAKAFVPLAALLGGENHITDAQFSHELDRIFDALYAHPLTEQTRRITTYLRSPHVLPYGGYTAS